LHRATFGAYVLRWFHQTTGYFRHERCAISITRRTSGLSSSIGGGLGNSTGVGLLVARVAQAVAQAAGGATEQFGQPRLRMMAFQVLAGVFEIVAMRCLPYLLRFSGIPKVYRVTQGSKVEISYLIDKYGDHGQTDTRSESGQRSCPKGEDRPTPIRINRTADTGIFSTDWANTWLYFSISYRGACCQLLHHDALLCRTDPRKIPA